MLGLALIVAMATATPVPSPAVPIRVVRSDAAGDHETLNVRGLLALPSRGGAIVVRVKRASGVAAGAPLGTLFAVGASREGGDRPAAALLSTVTSLDKNLLEALARDPQATAEIAIVDANGNVVRVLAARCVEIVQ